MTSANQIHEKVKEYLAPGSYEIIDIDYIPEIDDRNITFGNKGVKIDASVLYLDMRDSTSVLQEHHKYTIAKLQKAYMHVSTQLVNDNLGQVRSFNGDGILAFFPKNLKSTIRNAVKAAMKIKYILTYKSKNEFERYHSIDFGIGIDHGELFVTKVGTPRNPNNNDLTWIGLPVNNSVRLGDAAKNPYNIRISSFVYENLLDEVKYHEKETVDILGNKRTEKIDMWRSQYVQINDTYQYVYDTNYYWTIPD